jgi:hypothetical protein
MIHESYVTDFVAEAKEDGITPESAARELLEKSMEQLTITLARVLSDVYGMEPSELARNVFYSSKGLGMSAVAGARALKIGLGLDAKAMAKMLRKLAFPSPACKSLLAQLRFFSYSEIEEAIESTYNVD